MFARDVLLVYYVNLQQSSGGYYYTLPTMSNDKGNKPIEEGRLWSPPLLSPPLPVGEGKGGREGVRFTSMKQSSQLVYVS